MELIRGHNPYWALGRAAAGRSQGNAVLLVAQVNTTRPPTNHITRPRVLVPNPEQLPDIIRIVAQSDLIDDIEALLETLRQRHDQGDTEGSTLRRTRISVSPTTIQPGRTVAQQPVGVTPITIW